MTALHEVFVNISVVGHDVEDSCRAPDLEPTKPSLVIFHITFKSKYFKVSNMNINKIITISCINLK